MAFELTDREEAMLQAIARWLKSEMVSQLKESSPSPDLLHDLAQTNYEISCCALANVGLLASEDQYWRVKDAENDQTEFAGRHNRRQLNDLLDGLVCHSDYVLDLSGEFLTPTETALQDVCRAMAECGYMYALTKDTFEWSEKLGPWLVRHRVWDLNDYEHAPQDEIDRALTVIPAEAQTTLSGRLFVDPSQFVRYFFLHWNNGTCELEGQRQTPHDDWDLCLAAGLYAQLHPT